VLRKSVIVALAAAVLPAAAHAQGKVTLLPGVTYEQGVQFTIHGAVAYHVLVAPKPDKGLYDIRPILSNDSILGRETVTSMQKRVSATATVAGVNGDLFNWDAGYPSGGLMRDGVLDHPPLGDRSTVGIDGNGDLVVDRVKFYGTWRGNGQRRPLNGLNEVGAANDVDLFTPSWGATTPRVAGVAEAVLAPFPPTTPNTDLTATVTELRQGGGTPIPPGSAVLAARGTIGSKLLSEAPVGTVITTRLILQPDWTGVVNALGGGPVIVRDGKPVFASLEGFDPSQLQPRNPRTAVGQLADGRYLFLAVDGRQPGYSVGMTNFELAQAMARLGAVTASALDAGGSTTMAFDGKLLSRPSDPGGERAVAESLDVFYYGAYTPEVEPAVLSPNGDGVDETAALAYKLVRPSSVTATLTGPDGVPLVLDQTLEGEVRQPGTYPFTWTGVDPVTGAASPEGRWTWTVTATDDLGRASTATRTFSLNGTLAAVKVRPPVVRLPPRGTTVTVSFTLSEPANAALRVESATGVILRTIKRPALAAGTQSISWDGRLPKGTLVHSGRYVAHVFVTNPVGTAELAQPFVVRRVAGPKAKPKPAAK
jgi:exopolysaccharide biosynthesis protein